LPLNEFGDTVGNAACGVEQSTTATARCRVESNYSSACAFRVPRRQRNASFLGIRREYKRERAESKSHQERVAEVRLQQASVRQDSRHLAAKKLPSEFFRVEESEPGSRHIVLRRRSDDSADSERRKRPDDGGVMGLLLGINRKSTSGMARDGGTLQGAAISSERQSSEQSGMAPAKSRESIAL
jgi:hypothetical protein